MRKFANKVIVDVIGLNHNSVQMQLTRFLGTFHIVWEVFP